MGGSHSIYNRFHKLVSLTTLIVSSCIFLHDMVHPNNILNQIIKIVFILMINIINQIMYYNQEMQP